MDEFTLRILEVGKSANILNELSKRYPNLAMSMWTNLYNVMALFYDVNCLHISSVGLTHKAFIVNNNPIQNKNWIPYNLRRCGNNNQMKIREKIKEEVEQFCEKLMVSNHTIPNYYLNKMKKKISDEIKNQYMQQFDGWTKEFTFTQRPINLHLKNSYDFGEFFIVWSCVGSILVNETKITTNLVKVEFNAALDTKCLLLNNVEAQYEEYYISERLQRLENGFNQQNEREKLAIEFLAP